MAAGTLEAVVAGTVEALAAAVVFSAWVVSAGAAEAVAA